MGNNQNRGSSEPLLNSAALRSDLVTIGLEDFLEQFEQLGVTEQDIRRKSKFENHKKSPEFNVGILAQKLTPCLTRPSEARALLTGYLAQCKTSVSKTARLSPQVTDLIFHYVNMKEVMFLRIVHVMESHFLDSDKPNSVRAFFSTLRALSWKLGDAEAHEHALMISLRFLNTISSQQRPPYSKIQLLGFESMCDSVRLLPKGTMLSDITIETLDQFHENYSEHRESSIRNLSYVLKNATKSCRPALESGGDEIMEEEPVRTPPEVIMASGRWY